MNVKKTVATLVMVSCFVSGAFAQKHDTGKQRHRSTTPGIPAHGDEDEALQGSQVGVSFQVVTPDHAGGVWLGGDAFWLRRFLLHDNDEQVRDIILSDTGYFHDLVFLTREQGWMILDGNLLSTGDGGFHWKEAPIKKEKIFRSISFSDLQNGWVAGLEGAIYHTNNGGAAWRKQKSGTDHDIEKIFFVDPLHGWATGTTAVATRQWSSVLIATKDGGQTWETYSKVDRASPQSVSPVFFVDQDEGWGVNGRNDIVHSVDGGKTWRVQHSSYPGQNSLSSIFFLNRREGWVVGNGIIHTSDGGKTWKYQREPEDLSVNYLDGVVFINSQRGWAIGTSRVVQTTDGGATWKPVSKKLVPEVVKLVPR